MKIGLVLDDTLDSTDGVQQYVITVGGWLSTQGHQVHYLVGETKRQDLKHVHSLSRNIRVRFNGNRLSIPLPASKRAIRKLLQQEQFDILHVQVPYSPWLARRIIALAGPKTVVVGTFHIAPYSGLVKVATRLLGMWLHKSLRRFSAVVAVSAAAANYAKQTFKLETAIIPNAIDYPLFHNAQPLPAYDDQILTILFLGRLVPRKGCLKLLEAVAILQQSPDLGSFRVVICGKGPLQATLQQFVATNGLRGIEFVGYVSETDKPRYYASADIAVFPSSGGESFGIVLVEAMSSGKTAVLAGDNAGYRSVLSPRPELLFNPTSSEQLASHLEQLMQDTAARQAIASWGVDYAKQFDIETVGQQLLNLYEQALHKQL